jgi:hypothetical protein
VAVSAQAGRGTLEREISIKDSVRKKRIFWGERMGISAGWTIMTTLEELTRAYTWPVKRGRTMSRRGTQAMIEVPHAESFWQSVEPGLSSLLFPLHISRQRYASYPCKSAPFQACYLIRVGTQRENSIVFVFRCLSPPGGQSFTTPSALRKPSMIPEWESSCMPYKLSGNHCLRKSPQCFSSGEIGFGR